MVIKILHKIIREWKIISFILIIIFFVNYEINRFNDKNDVQLIKKNFVANASEIKQGGGMNYITYCVLYKQEFHIPFTEKKKATEVLDTEYLPWNYCILNGGKAATFLDPFENDPYLKYIYPYTLWAQ